MQNTNNDGQVSARTLFKSVGKGMDSDVRNEVYGKPGTESIPYLHKKPTSNEEILLAAYEIMRSSGVTLKVEYHPEDFDLDMTCRAHGIRLEAQKEKNGKPTL